jgi:hypothetical protein
MEGEAFSFSKSFFSSARWAFKRPSKETSGSSILVGQNESGALSANLVPIEEKGYLSFLSHSILRLFQTKKW